MLRIVHPGVKTENPGRTFSLTLSQAMVNPVVGQLSLPDSESTRTFGPALKEHPLLDNLEIKTPQSPIRLAWVGL
jgi:hypothetical protein